MFTIIFLWLSALVFFIIGYLIKYKKKYYLIAGLTDYKQKKIGEVYKKKSIIIAESTFFLSFLLIAFSIINLYVDWFKKLPVKDLDGLIILIISLLIAVTYFIITTLLTKNLKK